ncbi:RING-H2 finger protein ATL70-like [Vigna umbellata]|uniref:RING-H2 finger protein ATL70-like n=1 Tax=Vigna umbellata TaxID=87088 RepID=UPI001F5EB180|nr:RING-H2 finger protein ATL70-like [Vigna umbellata]
MSSNTAVNSPGFLGSSNISGYSYGIGISIGILLLIITITLTSYFCTRTHVSFAAATRNRRFTPNVLQPDHSVVDVSLDEATILSYPTLLYSEAKARKRDSTATCCSICLADYKDTDMLRMLPDCGHQFHLKCIDPWLRLHPTCPVCRTSPIPTPLSTPLAEVVPFAIIRDS